LCGHLQPPTRSAPGLDGSDKNLDFDGCNHVIAQITCGIGITVLLTLPTIYSSMAPATNSPILVVQIGIFENASPLTPDTLAFPIIVTISEYLQIISYRPCSHSLDTACVSFSSLRIEGFRSCWGGFGNRVCRRRGARGGKNTIAAEILLQTNFNSLLQPA